MRLPKLKSVCTARETNINYRDNFKNGKESLLVVHLIKYLCCLSASGCGAIHKCSCIDGRLMRSSPFYVHVKIAGS